MSDINLFQQFEQGNEITAHAEFSESIDLAWPSPAQPMQQELNTLAEAGTDLSEAEDQATAGPSTAAASAQNAQEIDLATKAGRVRIHRARDYLANSTNYSRTCKIKGIKLFLVYTATTQAPNETISTLENGIRNECN